MIYKKIIEGNFVKLRSITLDDAEFSYNLRKDSRFVSIMGQPAGSVEEQKKFIEWQMQQPGDYYFVVLNRQNERIGLIGAYNILDNVCEIGREINIGAPYETMEAEILINEFIVNELHIQKETFVIYKHNEKQLLNQKKLGRHPIKEVVRSGVDSYEFEVPTEEILKDYEKARKLINQLAKKINREI